MLVAAAEVTVGLAHPGDDEAQRGQRGHQPVEPVEMVTTDLLAMLVPAFPLFGAVVIAMLRRRLKGNSAGVLGTALIALSFACSVLLFVAHDVVMALHGAGLHQERPAEGAIHIVMLFDWISVGGMHIPFAFQIDALSLTMMLIVTGVGSLIHLYSIGYMHDDERVTTFFSQLNLFTFAMLHAGDGRQLRDHSSSAGRAWACAATC